LSKFDIEPSSYGYTKLQRAVLSFTHSEGTSIHPSMEISKVEIDASAGAPGPIAFEFPIWKDSLVVFSDSFSAILARMQRVPFQFLRCIQEPDQYTKLEDPLLCHHCQY
jgi:hypothetical protein